ncbi:MAG: hypothetical protein ACQ9MH_27425 [Nitrospinales bacterium]
MIVRFGLAQDGKIPERSETLIGHVSAGPQGFLSILETQLGLTVPNISPAVRMVQYHECLRKMDSPARFYHRSFEVDALAVARTLLGWRDIWYLAGWDGTNQTAASGRLQDIAEVETLAKGKVAPSTGERLQTVVRSLSSRKTGIKAVQLPDYFKSSLDQHTFIRLHRFVFSIISAVNKNLCLLPNSKIKIFVNFIAKWSV